MKKGIGIGLILLGILNIVRTLGTLNSGYSTGSEIAMNFFWVLAFIAGGILLIRSASKNKSITEIEEPIKVDKKDSNNNGAIINKEHSSFASELSKKRITLAFEERIEDTLKNKLLGDSASDGLLLYSTIASTLQRYKENDIMQRMSELSPNDYNKMVENIALDMRNKYLK